jgi:hypothetical protein
VGSATVPGKPLPSRRPPPSLMPGDPGEVETRRDGSGLHGGYLPGLDLRFDVSPDLSADPRHP